MKTACSGGSSGHGLSLGEKRPILPPAKPLYQDMESCCQLPEEERKHILLHHTSRQVRRRVRLFIFTYLGNSADFQG